MAKKSDINLCPCGTGKTLTQCCQPFINGTTSAPTAEALMRSRYTAYAQLNLDYLRETWHSATCPENITLDASTQWLRLRVIQSEHDRVEFVATYRIQGKAHQLHECSRFVYEDRRWLYLDGLTK